MLQVNFITVYIIHKIPVLLKITRISKHFLRSIMDFHFFTIIINFFSKHTMMESSGLEEYKNIEKNIKDVRNIFSLKKKTT